jgi:hypothetical protein
LDAFVVLLGVCPLRCVVRQVLWREPPAAAAAAAAQLKPEPEPPEQEEQGDHNAPQYDDAYGDEDEGEGAGSRGLAPVISQVGSRLFCSLLCLIGVDM